MKTIFIPIFQGVEAKNILRTDIYRKLLEEENLRIVLFLNNPYKLEYYQKEFNHPRVSYEVVGQYRLPSFNKLFAFLKFNLLKTKTMDLRRKRVLEKDRKYLKYYLKLLFNRVFTRRVFRKIVRWLDYSLVKDNNFVHYFEKHNPDLVLLAHLFGDEETSMLRQAKKRGITSIGLINSWDKLTCRCTLRLLPDKMIVHNDINKAEAILHTDMPEQDIIVVGVPHFDHYITGQRCSREDFCRKLGIDVKKRIVLYSPLGKYYHELDWEVVEILDNFLKKKLLPADVHFLVRYHPKDRVDLSSLARDNFTFEKPGKTFSKRAGKNMRFQDLIDWDLSFEDMEHIADTMRHSSLVVCYSSSIGIDAAIFDTPVININFDVGKIGGQATSSYLWVNKTGHYQNYLKCGGSRLAANKKELIYWINNYLLHPKIDREGRSRVIREQCWRPDGRAGERTAKFILQQVQ